MKYFAESYEQCRIKFRQSAAKIIPLFENVEVSWLSVASEIDSDLTMDYCYIPAQKEQKRLLILMSGIHGVEGYVGSAVQQMFLSEMVPTLNYQDQNHQDLGILIVHAINPYGFKYKRRVSENNVDLNRNCMADPEGFQSQNKGYAALNGWLNKNRKLNVTEFNHFFFPLYSVQKMLKHSKKIIRQAILQGQYDYKNGIYYGGQSLEPNIKLLTGLLKRVGKEYETVFAIDLHSGYGKRGNLHLFPMSLDSISKKQRIETLFKGFHIDWGDTNDFYTVNGDLLSYIEQILTPPKYMSMPFEFGTLDTQTTMGAMKALHNVIIENQGAHLGYANKRDESIAQTRFLEGYFPSSPAWRSKAIRDARVLFKHIIKEYGARPVD